MRARTAFLAAGWLAVIGCGGDPDRSPAPTGTPTAGGGTGGSGGTGGTGASGGVGGDGGVAPGPSEACLFEPPSVIYGDGFGGIDEVRWAINPRGDAIAQETTDGCRSGSCIEVDQLGQYDGFHLYYRQAFPTDTFATVSLWLRALSGESELVVAPSLDGERCAETTVTVGAEWTEVTVDLAATCTSLASLNGVTVSSARSR